MTQSIAIIGYGTAAVNCIVALRENDYTGAIDVFSSHALPPTSPVVVSYYASEKLEYDKCFPWDQEMLDSLNYTLHKNCPVTSLDVEGHKIITPEGEFSFDKCLVATGSMALQMGFPKQDGCNPLKLRSMEDGVALKEILDAPVPPKVLVSGASMVALKAVEACLARGAKVSMVGMNNQVLETSALPQIAPLYQEALSQAGVDLYLERTVKQAIPVADGTFDITLSDGMQFNVDAVLAAHGMRPDLGFIEKDSLQMDRGLLVDNFMRTSNPDIYAAGDVTQAVDILTGRPLVLATWRNACDQGVCAGTAMACDLAGTPVPQSASYEGSLRSNTVNVGTITLISGGDVFCPDSRVEVEQKDDITIATVWQSMDGGERLIGYNVFCADAKPGSRAYDEAAHLLRRMKASL